MLLTFYVISKTWYSFKYQCCKLKFTVKYQLLLDKALGTSIPCSDVLFTSG